MENSKDNSVQTIGKSNHSNKKQIYSTIKYKHEAAKIMSEDITDKWVPGNLSNSEHVPCGPYARSFADKMGLEMGDYKVVSVFLVRHGPGYEAAPHTDEKYGESDRSGLFYLSCEGHSPSLDFPEINARVPAMPGLFVAFDSNLVHRVKKTDCSRMFLRIDYILISGF